jgi:hypothetical protein
LHLEGGSSEIHVTIHLGTSDAPPVATGKLSLRKERLWTDWATIGGLTPDRRYFYWLWTNAACSIPLDLHGLTREGRCADRFPGHELPQPDRGA